MLKIAKVKVQLELISLFKKNNVTHMLNCQEIAMILEKYHFPYHLHQRCC